MMKSDFLLFASSLLVLSNAAAGSRHSHGNNVADEWNSAVIRIPGSVKKTPIEFTAGIGPPVVAKLDFESTDAKGVNIALAERRAVVVVRASATGAQSEGKAVQKFVLLNPRLLTGIGTPIPLEAEVLLTHDSEAKQAKVSSIVPDSVAAWRRLKEWRDLTKPRKGRGVSGSTVTRVDRAAESIRVSVQRVFQAGNLDKVETEDLLEKYEELSDSLRAASDENTDFDVSRQIAIAVTGVHGERLAWEQAWEEVLPVLNPKYLEYSKAAIEGSGRPSPDPAAHPKAFTSFDDSAVPNRYIGYDEIQKPLPTLAYKRTYQQARATVAVCENDEAFASGTIIGRNLILTCAHAVARPGRMGKPAARNRQMLSVKIGYEFPDDNESPEKSIPATILFEGLVLVNNADPLDFALLTAEIEERYNVPRFYAAQQRIKGILADQTLSKGEQMREVEDATFLPIEPLPLANFDYKEATAFDIAGHPRGQAKRVCGHGKILYPFRLEGAGHDLLYKSIEEKTLSPQRRAELSQVLEAMYTRQTDPDNTLWYQYTYGNNSPGIGVICQTIGGNSGGAAVADTRPARDADTSDPRCVIGILVEGQSGNPSPWEPGMEHHEILLPTTAIIKQLDAQSAKLNPQPFHTKWDKEYGVTILEKDTTNETIHRRP